MKKLDNKYSFNASRSLKNNEVFLSSQKNLVNKKSIIH